MIEFLLPPLLTLFVLSVPMSFFGLEILRRGIIFTDLAVAQFSALGVACGLIISGGSLSEVSAVAGGVIGGVLAGIGVSRGSYKEAYIGILYALGISTTFIVLSKLPQGAEEFRRMTASDLLFIGWDDLVMSLLFSVVSLAILKTRAVLGNLAFFISFSLIVSFGVGTAGVLIVFSLLVGPALLSCTFGGCRWLYASLVASALSLISLLLSYILDLPSGYTLVFITSTVTCAFYLIRGTTSTAGEN